MKEIIGILITLLVIETYIMVMLSNKIETTQQNLIDIDLRITKIEQTGIVNDSIQDAAIVKALQSANESAYKFKLIERATK